MEENVEKGKIYGDGAEKILSTVAWVVIGVGGLVLIMCLVFGIWMLVSGMEEGPIGFAFILIGVLAFCGSVISWSTIRVLCNISNNVREINRNTR